MKNETNKKQNTSSAKIPSIRGIETKQKIKAKTVRCTPSRSISKAKQSKAEWSKAIIYRFTFNFEISSLAPSLCVCLVLR